MHQRHVQVGERRHRTTVAVRRQAGDAGSFEEEFQQLGLLENPRDQLAVLEVIARQCGLVLGEHPVDFVHALVRRGDRFTFAKQGLCDVFQAEGFETPGGRAQGFDAVNDQSPGCRSEVVVAAAVFAPAHGVAATAQQQRHVQALRMLVQDPQVELHQVPADDRVGVMGGEPQVQAFEEFGAGVAVVELEVHRIGLVGRAEHVHLALAAAFQGDGIQVALGGGLDVQRYQLERWAIIRRGFHLRLHQHAALARRTAKPHWRGDEALHHVAIGWAHIAFVDVDAGFAQALFQVHQLAMLFGVEAQHRAMVKVAQRQIAQFDTALALELQLGGLAMGLGDEHHGGLHRQAHTPGALIGGQPETDLRTRRGVAPMPGQDKPLL